MREPERDPRRQGQPARQQPGRRHARDPQSEIGRPGYGALDARYDAPWYDDAPRNDPRHDVYGPVSDDPYAAPDTYTPGHTYYPDRGRPDQDRSGHDRPGQVHPGQPSAGPGHARPQRAAQQSTDQADGQAQGGQAQGGQQGPEHEHAAQVWPPGWAPIVVDRPTTEFEPKPPGARHLPDTEFDGWSTAHATVRLASVRGYSHRYYGKPRQDHVEACVHAATGTVLFAVADGVSSAEEAEVGARLACGTALAVMTEHLDAGHAPQWREVLRTAADQLLMAAARRYGRAIDPAEAEKLFATTLVAGFATPAPEGLTASMARIGDSGAWLLAEGQYRPALGAKDDPAAAVVSSAVHPLPRVPDPPDQTQLTLVPGQVLLVGTDGFGDALGDGRGQVGRLFAQWLAQPPPARGLAHLLDFSRETFDDDRTLLALWPRTVQGSGAGSGPR
ncbi:protein phosphatase 2C domain-containing protein [Actinocrinis puniceicyclus]|uniref:Protein phosphatase 2C domain-containing protein n=1 Tax=Actinocrinis puniceicyclus TaxID=977794 RepID=A0A8J8BEC0_9ACTN|nr:protein phosphatase 2C domain-containing protein [Actinocrinis puniceicyclus]MBS2965365.1 protein phosphatase 2C domain-containing protein [Actinocrinis puniceicyclus]